LYLSSRTPPLRDASSVRDIRVELSCPLTVICKFRTYEGLLSRVTSRQPANPALNRTSTSGCMFMRKPTIQCIRLEFILLLSFCSVTPSLLDIRLQVSSLFTSIRERYLVQGGLLFMVTSSQPAKAAFNKTSGCGFISINIPNIVFACVALSSPVLHLKNSTSLPFFEVACSSCQPEKQVFTKEKPCDLTSMANILLLLSSSLFRFLKFSCRMRSVLAASKWCCHPVNITFSKFLACSPTNIHNIRFMLSAPIRRMLCCRTPCCSLSNT